MIEIPHRPTFWNIPVWGEIGVYVLGLLAVAVLVWGVWKNVQYWRQANTKLPVKSGLDKSRSLLTTLSAIFVQRKIRQTKPGRWHFGLAWGFFFLFLGTVLATLDWDVGHLVFGQQFLTGDVYLLYKLILDIAGFGALIALGLSALRRWSWEKDKLPGDKRYVCAYSSLAFIIITGFMLEGLRLAATLPPWTMFSPVGALFVRLYLALGLTVPQMETLHLWVWIIHGIAALLFVASIPLTIYAHLYRTPRQIYASATDPIDQVKPIKDIEEQETFGLSQMSQLTQKQRIALDACTECGRCNNVCPALKAGTPLAPRNIIVNLRNKLHTLNAGEDAPISEVVSHDELWSCTTCGACQKACPAAIAIPELIVDMRRHLALEQGEFPEGVATVLENVASVGNPWGLDPYERLDWAKDLNVPVAKPGEHYDILYWVGCAASYDRRTRKVARAMVEILHAARVNFAVMAEERCHGEFARRLGEEYLFQTAAQENKDNLAQYTFDRILVTCPHCLNTLKHEYPQLGEEDFNVKVVAHSEFIKELMKADKLDLDPLARKAMSSVVYHDPCYLARLNGIVDAPREVLRTVTPDLRKPELNREDTLCCGAGGRSNVDGSSQ